MSITSSITALAQALGGDFKALRTLVNGNKSSLVDLTTTAKTSLVAAINEINAKPTGTGGAQIDDTTPSATTTFSSNKINTELATKAASSHTHTIANVTNLQTTLDGKAASSHTHTIANVTNLQTTLDGKVGVTAQTLTAAQQLQACTNLDIGDPTTNFLTAYTTARDA